MANSETRKSSKSQGEIKADSYSEGVFQISTATYKEFLTAQEVLRSKGRPTIPYIDMSARPGYLVSMEMVHLVKKYGLEGNINVALGGVTTFIETEEDFKNLQKFMDENPGILVLLPE